MIWMFFLLVSPLLIFTMMRLVNCWKALSPFFKSLTELGIPLFQVVMDGMANLWKAPLLLRLTKIMKKVTLILMVMVMMEEMVKMVMGETVKMVMGETVKLAKGGDGQDGDRETVKMMMGATAKMVMEETVKMVIAAMVLMLIL